MTESKQYRKTHTHKVWAYRDDGSKFLAHFKNGAEAEQWSNKTRTRIQVAHTTPKRTKKTTSGFGFGGNPWKGWGW